jgi:hypothetical protein
MNQKKRPAEPEASAAIQTSIKRSLVPPTALPEARERFVHKVMTNVLIFHEHETQGALTLGKKGVTSNP